MKGILLKEGVLLLLFMSPALLVAQASPGGTAQPPEVSTDFPVDYNKYVPELDRIAKALNDPLAGHEGDDSLTDSAPFTGSFDLSRYTSDRTFVNGFVLFLLMLMFFVYKFKSGKKRRG